jgi:hypothetical protein
MKPIIAIPILVALAGCASSGDYQSYLAAQQQANAAYTQKPILLMEGYDGQPITGLKRIEVNLPGQAPVIQQAKDNEWARVVSQGLGVFGTIGGIWAGGEAAKGLAGAVGSAANHGYEFVQSPQPNLTIGGSGVIGSGSYNYNAVSGSGVIGSGTLNSVGATGAAGGTYTAPSTSTTGSYNPDNSNQGNPVHNCTTGPC